MCLEELRGHRSRGDEDAAGGAKAEVEKRAMLGGEVVKGLG